MFIISFAIERRWEEGKESAGPPVVLGQAMSDVMGPVTLTSIINVLSPTVGGARSRER